MFFLIFPPVNEVSEELAKSMSFLDAVYWNTAALKKCGTWKLSEVFQKARFTTSRREVMAGQSDSVTETTKKSSLI